MSIFCACPFVVGTLTWEPAPGRRTLSVCVKATFVLGPGTATIAPVQEPLRADPGEGALASDLVPFKPRVDVILTGHAHAPGGAPIDSILARARIGAFRKSLSINGDRTWVPSFDGLRPSVAVPFRRMPLVYDRAVRTGENLTGVDISQGADLHRPLANIAAIADQGGETPGFAPIPLPWRGARYGLADAALLWASRPGLLPPPAGFDYRVFNAAPLEQQVEDLPPGTEILLENLHPDHPRLETRLPALRVKVFRRPPRGDRSVEQPARLDTLWIDCDRGLAFALYRAAVPLEGDEVGAVTIAAEGEGDRIGPAEVDSLLARFAPEVTYVDPGVLLGDRGSYPPMPEPIPLPPHLPESLYPASMRPAAPAGMESIAQTPSAPPGPLPIPTAALPPPPVVVAEELTDEPTPQPSAPRESGEVVAAAAVLAVEEPEPARGPITLVPPPAEPAPAEAALPFRGAPPIDSPSRSASFALSALPAAWAAAAGEDGGEEVVDEVRDDEIHDAEEGTQDRLPVPDHDDDEATPPRGYPSISEVLMTAPAPAPPAPAPVAPEPSALMTAPMSRRGRFGTLVPDRDPAASASTSLVVLSTEAYAAARAEAWRSEEALGVVLARRGLDEAAFRAHDAELSEALGREAAEGRSEMAVAVLEALGAKRGT